ncbi:hypothetical protein AMAG_05948 [Allomyces macrogynus ATCC 38327]|uniref:Uncharacterized protein n=1 Tax=Allomyces macrogynus (strain ATCC 38327) TaxID=578462 RepID=A0A0L0SDV5_ALLM3|nr:hypothetical protein AMAG_05948 [Allomyces macrogynus ATCC 38327]|eukprot:KNE60570.1 hypothetical protein AMAG_05948 [Allomyces macrogynus ATCC 38327]
MHKFLATPLPRTEYVFGELTLLPLNYSLTRTTTVMTVRMFDDVWIWSSVLAEMVRAWNNMLEFTPLAGLALNLDKSGSAVIHARKGDAAAPIASFAPEPLPQSRVTWSSLVMHADATFRPDYENEVKVHVLEAQARSRRRQLCWLHVWGKAGIEPIKNELVQIHQGLFPETDGNMIAALAERLRRVDVDVADSLLDTWVYWLLTMGGLEVCNPFVTIAGWIGTANSLEKRKELDQDFEGLDESNRKQYKEALARHEKYFKAQMKKGGRPALPRGRQGGSRCHQGGVAFQ